MKKAKLRRLPFTAKNVVSSFSAVTGIVPARLSVVEKLGPSATSCEIKVGGPVVGDRCLEDVTVYRDQEALDKSAAYDLSYDEYAGCFRDAGSLSREDVLRCFARGCTLSDLRHWIIAAGRDDGLDDAQIGARLRRPLETLVEHYRDVGLEGALSTLVRQCRSDGRQAARHLLRAAGGAQKIWTNELYEVLPGGFIVHLILSEDISLFRQLAEAAEKSSAAPTGRKA